jgi:hypothetical protein
MRHAGRVTTLIGIALALSAPGVSASTGSPALYRAQMNGRCRVNGAIKRQVDKQLGQAVRTQHPGAIFESLGREVGLLRIQNRQLAETPFPPELHSRMAPTLVSIGRLDTLLRRVVSIARTGNFQAMLSDYDKASPVEKRVARRLRAAGLTDCAAIYR